VWLVSHQQFHFLCNAGNALKGPANFRGTGRSGGGAARQRDVGGRTYRARRTKASAKVQVRFFAGLRAWFCWLVLVRATHLKD
jgi:hypothetical protein